MIKAITSKDNPRVKFAYSLKDNKNRKKEQFYRGHISVMRRQSMRRVFNEMSSGFDNKIITGKR